MFFLAIKAWWGFALVTYDLVGQRGEDYGLGGRGVGWNSAVLCSALCFRSIVQSFRLKPCSVKCSAIQLAILKFKIIFYPYKVRETYLDNFLGDKLVCMFAK